MMTKKIAEGAPSEEVRETDWEWEGPFSEGEYQILAPDRIIAVVYRKQDVDKILNALAAPPAVDAETWKWEYWRGRLDSRVKGGAFGQAGVIDPEAVQRYIAEGGEVLKRKVTPFEQVEAPGGGR